MLQRPFDLEVDEIPLKCDGDYGYSKIHPYLDRTLTDVFEKVDINGNHQLEAHELVKLGKAIKIDYFQQLKQSEFTKENYDKAS